LQGKAVEEVTLRCPVSFLTHRKRRRNR